MTEAKLPKGWTTAQIKELIAPDGILTDGDWIESRDQDPAGLFRLLQLADISDGALRIRSDRFVNEGTFNRLGCSEVLAGDVLVARMPEPLGRACFVHELEQRCITVVDIAILRVGSDSVDAKWLMHFINAPSTRQSLEHLSSGSTRRRISRANFGKLPIPVPPLSEQRRIATKLEALLQEVDASVKSLESTPVTLEKLRMSVLAAASAGELTAKWRKRNGNRKWRTGLLKEFVTSFSYGSSAKSSASGTTPVLRMGNIQDGQIDWSSLVYTSNSREIEKYKLSSGDVLFNRTNSPELVGKTAVYRGERTAIFAGYLIRVSCAEGLLPDFLGYCLNGPTGREYCQRVKTDGVSQSNINAKKLADFPISIPSIEEQREIVRCAEEMLQHADELQKEYLEARARVDGMRPALLSKAISGELVEQNPEDEPASRLVEQLAHRRRAQRAEPTRRARKGDLSVAKSSEETLKEVIKGFPPGNLSFDDIRAKVPLEYEDLRDAVFKLLGDPSSGLSQKFDPKLEAIVFVRAKS